MKWISVRQRLPKPFHPVWIFHKDNEVIIGYRALLINSRSPEEGWFTFTDNNVVWTNYWMPLVKPNPPTF